jgi:hypothetical protein
MPRIPQETVTNWCERVERHLIDNHGITRAGIRAGVEAWAVIGRVGILAEAYQDRTITDAHIQTALERVFPNCVFRDRKVY